MTDESKMSVNEHAEPVAGNSQMPVGVMIILTLLGYIGCTKVDQLNANFAANVHAPFGSADEVASLAPSEEELVLSTGKKLYANCQGCHQPTGGGTPGQIPPLAGSEWVLGDSQKAAAIVINGLGGPIEVAGKSFNGAMTAVGATWTDEQVAAVLTYIRSEWGNDAGRVMPEEVAEAKKKIQASGQSGPWTVDTLNAAFPAE
tara:strand:- start:1185 stop:1790 length:606 start_codon:yes stop_codon:yes gene_type:complete